MINYIYNYVKGKFKTKVSVDGETPLETTIKVLIAGTNTEALNYFKRLEENSIPPHFSGMALRNNLNLWKSTGPLNVWFREHGVWHGDDKSAILYRALWCKLNGISFNIDEESRYYKLYWARWDLGFDSKKLVLTDNERNKNKEDFEKEEAKRYPKRFRYKIIPTPNCRSC